MKKNICYIVGDKYKNLTMCHSFETITYSHLIEKMINNEECLNKTFAAGQGLCEEQLMVLRDKGVHFINNPPQPILKKIVHKRKRENVMITEPTMLDSAIFASNLRIDDRCAELSDHVTGVHISGNALIEAGRQMTIACIEKFCIHPKYRYFSRFVWNDMQINFLKFLFPINVNIRATLLSQDKTREDKWKGTFKIEYWQMDELGCEVNINMSTYASKWLERKEFEFASHICTKAVEKISNERPLAA